MSVWLGLLRHLPRLFGLPNSVKHSHVARPKDFELQEEVLPVVGMTPPKRVAYTS